MPDTTRYSYMSDGTKYTFIYYFAIAKTNIEPHISLTNKVQIGEIVDIKWMNLLAIQQIDGEGRLYQCARKIFKFMKRHAR